MRISITLFVTIYLLTAGLCNAQGGFIKGYVITNAGDTIFGQVKDRTMLPHIMLSKIKLKPENGGDKLSFSPSQIKGYKKGNDLFESISCYLDTIVFVKVIHKGFLSLYKYEWEGVSGSTLLLKKQNNPCVTEVNGLDIREQLLNYFDDSTPIRERLREKGISRDQLADIVTLYNQIYTSTK